MLHRALARDPPRSAPTQWSLGAALGQLGRRVPRPSTGASLQGPGSAGPGDRSRAQRVQWAVMAARIPGRSPSPRPTPLQAEQASPLARVQPSPGHSDGGWTARSSGPHPPLTFSLNPQASRAEASPASSSTSGTAGKAQGQRTPCLTLRQGQPSLAKSPRRPRGRSGFLPPLPGLPPTPGRPAVSPPSGARAPPWRAWVTAPTSRFPSSRWLLNCFLSKGLSGFPGGSICLLRRRPGFDCGLGRSPGKGNGSPLQCSCLGNPMDRGAWWATVHEAARDGHN